MLDDVAVPDELAGRAEFEANAGDLPRMLDQMQRRLARDFSLQHSTIQFETAAHAEHERPEHD